MTTKESEHLTAISDADFDLRSVFSEAAEGSQVCVKYIDDAPEEGDTDLVRFSRMSRSRRTGGRRRRRR